MTFIRISDWIPRHKALKKTIVKCTQFRHCRATRALMFWFMSWFSLAPLCPLWPPTSVMLNVCVCVCGLLNATMSWVSLNSTANRQTVFRAGEYERCTLYARKLFTFACPGVERLPALQRTNGLRFTLKLTQPVLHNGLAHKLSGW